METIQVETNIHCEKCVDKLTPHFENEQKISSWSVDLDSDDKTLRVKGDYVTKDLIADVLDREGYEITNYHGSSQGFWGNRDK